MENPDQIPVIFLHGTSGRAHQLIDLTKWEGESQSIAQSCVAQYGLMNYSVVILGHIFKNAEKLCADRLKEYPVNLEEDKFDFNKCDFQMEIPVFHFYIQAFLGHTKTFLDLVVQLFYSEGIITAKLDGFHRKKKIYGGKVLDVLKNNAVLEKKSQAIKLIELIDQHKSVWIDNLIKIRDVLVHLPPGLPQLMIKLEFKKHGKDFSIIKAYRPMVGLQSFDDYAKSTLNEVDNFVKELIQILNKQSQ